jgi:hypothetical protein
VSGLPARPVRRVASATPGRLVHRAPWALLARLGRVDRLALQERLAPRGRKALRGPRDRREASV